MHRNVFDLTEASLAVYESHRLDGDRPVVPTVGNYEGPTQSSCGRVQIPGVSWRERKWPLAENMGAGLQPRLRLLPMGARRARDENHIRFLGDHLLPIGGCLQEAELLLDAGKRLGI